MKSKKTLQRGTELSLLCASLVLASGLTGCSKDQTEIQGPLEPTKIETKGNPGLPGLPGGYIYPDGSQPLLSAGTWHSFETVGGSIYFRTILPTNFNYIRVTVKYANGTTYTATSNSTFPPGPPSEGPANNGPYVVVSSATDSGKREFSIIVGGIASSAITKILFAISTK